MVTPSQVDCSLAGISTTFDIHGVTWSKSLCYDWSQETQSDTPKSVNEQSEE